MTPLVIEVPMLSQASERTCICMLRTSILPNKKRQGKDARTSNVY